MHMLDDESELSEGPSESDYDNLLDRVKALEDYEAFAEFSIEDVIYQISKVLFRQAIERGK